MPGSLARIAVLALAFVGPANAAELDDFNAAIEKVAAHNRVAIGYLRTGNIDLAAIEIDRMRNEWAEPASKFARPFGPFAGNVPLYATTMLDISMRLVAASIMVDTGRPDNARQSLTAIRDELSALRKSAGVTVLADCVRDSSDALDVLFAYDGSELDWAKPAVASGVADAAAAYRQTLARCDAMAPESVRNTPEFRRLVDGAKSSLGLVAETIAARDSARLHRILIELRSFDDLLAFRFG